GVGLGGQLAGGLAIRPDARPMTPAVLVVIEVPDQAAAIGPDAADAERVGRAGHGGLGESHRHKTPQTAPQTGGSGTAREKQRPGSQGVMACGLAGKRRGGDSNPRGGLTPPNGLANRDPPPATPCDDKGLHPTTDPPPHYLPTDTCQLPLGLSLVV